VNLKRRWSVDSASELLDSLRDLGIRVIVDGADLVLSPGAMIPANLIPKIRERKPELLRLLTAKRFDPSDRDTWPGFLVRLEQLSLKQFGPKAAARQVWAEVAFLARAEADGWIVLPDSRKGGAA
jgi:hypothetical protein